jgi:hypothetical protein
VCALGLGIAMDLAWRVNMLDNYSSAKSVVQGVFGQILTALAIGGTASGDRGSLKFGEEAEPS